MKLYNVSSTLLTGLFVLALNLPGTATAENWPCWRGPRGDSISEDKDAPVQWDAANLSWKTAVPGVGHASPIVWGDRIYTVTAFPDKLERTLLCFNRTSGNLFWQKTVVSGPLEKIHQENSYASGTPATDGKRVFTVFRVGDEIVIAAHDAESGKQLWLVRPGTHAGEWGFSNVPVLYKDKVIVDADSKGASFLIALSQADGRTMWRVDRTHRGISYSAPLIREMAGRVQLIQCGDRCVTGFNPDTGEEVWKVDGPSQEFVATPSYSEKSGLVFVSSSWPDRHLLAIKPDGRGDVTRTHVTWRTTRGAPYVPSLLIANEYLLAIEPKGIAFGYEAATGNLLWQEQLARHHASPVLLRDLVFAIDDNGVVNVIRLGREFQRVGQYELGEPCYASPAISDGQVFVRGFKNLICFGKRAS
jgi:outer membrane protein assembly factor BamB